MLKIAIVDDDAAIRQELRRFLARFSSKCTVLLEADDGDGVVDHELLPRLDLILTDINMRRVGGIQLIKAVKSRYPEIEIVVLSNYDDFSLVRDAMKYGASDYLLKYQMLRESIEGIVDGALHRKANAKIREARLSGRDAEMIIASHLLRDYINGLMDFQELYQGLGSMDVHIGGKNASLFMLCAKGRPDAFQERRSPALYELLKCRPHCFFWESEPGCLLAVLFDHQTGAQIAMSESFAFATELMARLGDDGKKRTVICHSAGLLDPERLPEALRSLRECAGNVFYLGTGMILDRSWLKGFRPLDRAETDPYCRRLEQLAAAGNRRELVTAAEALISRVRAEKYDPGQVKVLFRSVLRSVCFAGMDAREREDFLLRADAVLNDSMCTLRELELLFTVIGEGMERRAEEAGAIGEAVRLIQREYQGSLTLDQAARICGYNKNYFCRLFKETYGCGFSEYLTRYRMERAAALLESANLSMKQVAVMVGLEYHHFCRTFRRYYNTTPSDYRHCARGRVKTG